MHYIFVCSYLSVCLSLCVIASVKMLIFRIIFAAIVFMEQCSIR
jgi:hypothetical protein